MDAPRRAHQRIHVLLPGRSRAGQRTSSLSLTRCRYTGERGRARDSLTHSLVWRVRVAKKIVESLNFLCAKEFSGEKKGKSEPPMISISLTVIACMDGRKLKAFQPNYPHEQQLFGRFSRAGMSGSCGRTSAQLVCPDRRMITHQMCSPASRSLRPELLLGPPLPVRCCSPINSRIFLAECCCISLPSFHTDFTLQRPAIIPVLFSIEASILLRLAHHCSDQKIA